MYILNIHSIFHMYENHTSAKKINVGFFFKPLKKKVNSQSFVLFFGVFFGFFVVVFFASYDTWVGFCSFGE